MNLPRNSAIDTTDDRGEASAVYRAVPYNTDVRVTASVNVNDSSLAVATTVTLSGLEVDVKRFARESRVGFGAGS